MSVRYRGRFQSNLISSSNTSNNSLRKYRYLSKFSPERFALATAAPGAPHRTAIQVGIQFGRQEGELLPLPRSDTVSAGTLRGVDRVGQ